MSAVALTPDGRRALAACRDGRIEVWDIEHGALARTLYGHGVFARCVVVAPDGHRAVSGARARPNEDPQELRVWDLTQADTIAVFEGHDHDFGEIAVLPDGRRAVSSSYDGTVRVWDLDDGHAIHVLRGHAWYVQALSVSADGRVAASGADDGTIRIWDLERGQAIRVLETDHPLRAASPDEIPPGGLIGITQVTGVALSPDGRLLVSTSPQEGMSSGTSIRAPDWRGFRSTPAIPGSRATATGWCSSSVLFRFGSENAAQARADQSHRTPALRTRPVGRRAVRRGR